MKHKKKEEEEKWVDKRIGTTPYQKREKSESVQVQMPLL